MSTIALTKGGNDWSEAEGSINNFNESSNINDHTFFTKFNMVRLICLTQLITSA